MLPWTEAVNLDGEWAGHAKRDPHGEYVVPLAQHLKPEWRRAGDRRAPGRRALVLRLLHDGHEVTAWVRDAERARSQLGAEVRLALAPPGESNDPLVAAHSGGDAVVNLAGENLFGGRWTASRRGRIESSRVELTARIVDALRAASPRPACWCRRAPWGSTATAGTRRSTKRHGRAPASSPI